MRVKKDMKITRAWQQKFSPFTSAALSMQVGVALATESRITPLRNGRGGVLATTHHSRRPHPHCDDLFTYSLIYFPTTTKTKIFHLLFSHTQIHWKKEMLLD